MALCCYRVVVLVLFVCLAIAALTEAVPRNVTTHSYNHRLLRGLSNIDSVGPEKPSRQRAVQNKRYYVSTLTGSKKGHGTTAKVYVKIHGTGSTYWAELDNPGKLDFERADCAPDTQRDEFVVMAEDVTQGAGKICRVDVRGVSFMADPWYLVNMTVRPEGGVTSSFSFNQLITRQDINRIYADQCGR